MANDRERLRHAVLDLRIYDHLVLTAHLNLLATLIRYTRVLGITNHWGFAEKVETSAHLLEYLEAFVAQRFCYHKCCKALGLGQYDLNGIHGLVRKIAPSDETLWKLRNRFHHDGFESIQAQVIPLNGKTTIACFFLYGHDDWSKLPPTWDQVIQAHYGAIERTFPPLWIEVANAWQAKFGARRASR